MSSINDSQLDQFYLMDPFELDDRQLNDEQLDDINEYFGGPQAAGDGPDSLNMDVPINFSPSIMEELISQLPFDDLDWISWDETQSNVHDPDVGGTVIQQQAHGGLKASTFPPEDPTSSLGPASDSRGYSHHNATTSPWLGHLEDVQPIDPSSQQRSIPYQRWDGSEEHAAPLSANPPRTSLDVVAQPSTAHCFSHPAIDPDSTLATAGICASGDIGGNSNVPTKRTGATMGGMITVQTTVISNIFVDMDNMEIYGWPGSSFGVVEATNAGQSESVEEKRCPCCGFTAM